MKDPRIPVPPPRNEPPREYRPGSAERALLEARIREMSGETAELPLVIGGKERSGPSSFVQRAPHRHELQLARVQAAGPQEVEQAIDQAPHGGPRVIGNLMGGPGGHLPAGR